LSVLQFQHVAEHPTRFPNRLLTKGVVTVSKVLYCNDLVPGCKFEAHGNSEEEILAAAIDHIATAHNMTDISDEILAMVRAAIHEEVRTRTRAAGA
jgi:predicted small metal-binding protein